MGIKKTKPKKKSPKKSPTKNAFLNLGKDIWPMERDVLYRPDRLKYVRKLIKPEGCVFCSAERAELGADTLCVYKTQFSMVLINKFPYNSGHLLVMPRGHEGDLLKLRDEVFMDVQKLVRHCVRGLQKIYDCGGINVGLNLGAVAGAGIPEHLHYHVIPRWSGDLNFFPLIADTKVLVESTEVTFEKMRSYFKKVSYEY